MSGWGAEVEPTPAEASALAGRPVVPFASGWDKRMFGPSAGTTCLCEMTGETRVLAAAGVSAASGLASRTGTRGVTRLQVRKRPRRREMEDIDTRTPSGRPLPY